MRRDNQPNDAGELVRQLEAASQLKGKGKATKRTFKILDTDKNIISWKFNEWDYGKDKIKLPSNARGLFTSDVGPSSKILVRGYDKFFNIDEVYFTKWEWLRANTKGPYYVSSKENGCIILISGLEDGTIIVCSKHSTGSRDDVDRNHATAGQKFLEEQLSKLNISVKEFAMKLHEMDVTAVAEYCDDQFEEHIVQYKGATAGLYLHGLNLNTPAFQTLPLSEVESIAKFYGFKTIEYFKKDTIDELSTTLDEFSKTGSYNGKEIEGFVIRCKLNNETADDYFFKFKFEEPYLMYRQWREVSRAYIHHRRRGDIKLTKHKFITNNYLDFVIPLIESDPKIADDFMKGYGIIELRKKFLDYYGKTGPEILNQELLDELNTVNALDRLRIDEETKFVFIPIATIGCGKTTTSLTLAQLFPEEWGLVINDDVPSGKNAKKEFIKRSLQVLQDKKAVILDRNNHQFRERQQIIDDFRELRDDYISHKTNVQFVCLNFIKEDPHSKELWDLTTERVLKRGDNHQSIKAATNEKEFLGIMSGFIKRFQPFEPSKAPDSEFDFVINLEVLKNSSLTNAEFILKQIHQKYPILVKHLPSEAEIRSSFQKALDFKPTITKEISKRQRNHQRNGQKKNAGYSSPDEKEKKKKPLYFSISLNGTELLVSELNALVQKKGFSHDDTLLGELQKNQRVQEEFHVTLAHINQGKRGNEFERKIWQTYMDYYKSKEVKDCILGAMSKIKLKKLIWDKKAMAVIVQLVEFRDMSTWELLPFEASNKFPHITIGTATKETKPVYSNELAEIASKYEKEGVYDDVSILQWDQETILVDLPLLVNF